MQDSEAPAPRPAHFGLPDLVVGLGLLAIAGGAGWVHPGLALVVGGAALIVLATRG